MGEPIRIEFQRSGGFAGITMRSVLDTRDLSPDQAKEIEEILERLNLEDMVRLTAERPAPGADRFEYELVIHKGNARYELKLPETLVTEDVKPVLEKMMEVARNR